MILGKFTYLFYMLIFTSIPIGILWAKNFRFLKKNIRIIFIVAIAAIIYQFITDPFAENWNAWFFSKDKIFDIWILNFPIENILFFFLVSIAISSATLTFVYYQEKGKFDKIFKKISPEGL